MTDIYYWVRQKQVYKCLSCSLSSVYCFICLNLDYRSFRWWRVDKFGMEICSV